MSQPKKTDGILDEAIRITSGDRRKNYGHPLPNHQRIADLWNGYLRARSVNGDGKHAITQPELDAKDVVILMMLVKVARELHVTKRDNALDIAGYARCLAQIQGHE